MRVYRSGCRGDAGRTVAERFTWRVFHMFDCQGSKLRYTVHFEDDVRHGMPETKIKVYSLILELLV